MMDTGTKIKSIGGVGMKIDVLYSGYIQVLEIDLNERHQTVDYQRLKLKGDTRLTDIHLVLAMSS